MQQFELLVVFAGGGGLEICIRKRRDTLDVLGCPSAVEIVLNEAFAVSAGEAVAEEADTTSVEIQVIDLC